MEEQRSIPMAQLELSNHMRRVWQEHVTWARLFVISLAEELKDAEATADRLLQSPRDIAKGFGKYYGKDAENRLEMLLTEHLTIAADLIEALMNQNHGAAEDLNRRWYANADEMAKTFSSINPHYDLADMRQMLYSHLELTAQEITARLKKDYAADVAAHDGIEEQALAMADDFTEGIVKQFSPKFYGM